MNQMELDRRTRERYLRRGRGRRRLTWLVTCLMIGLAVGVLV